MSQENLNSESTLIQIIETIFSLQWCRENIDAPLGMQVDVFTGEMKLTIAIGNFAYLGTIGDFIKYRAAKQGIECLFMEKDPSWIQDFLDRVCSE